MASTGEHFSLRWNNYSNHITNAFDSLRSQEDFVDVTLCCEGRKIRAHKVLLSACSLYFRDVFKENPCQHPVIVFKNVQYEDLLALIEFMYQGEVSVQQDSLPTFLSTAELLSVQGLTGGSTSTPIQSAIETPIITLPSSSQTTFLTSHQQNVPTKMHHAPMVKQRTDNSTAAPNKLSPPSDPNIKTFSVQAVVNKTQVPVPISIPATVKLRAIPATSSAHSTKPNVMEHQPILIHQSGIVQHQQQQHQQQQTMENTPIKKRRMSLDMTVATKGTRQQLMDENEYVLSDAIDQEHHLQAQTGDEADTQDEEDEDEEEEETEQFLKMEIPFMDDEGQQEQHDPDHNPIEDEMLDDDDEEHLEHVNLAGGVPTDQSQADGEEQYAMMDSSELDIMYQQQQGSEMGRIYVTQTSSVDESGHQESDNIKIAGTNSATSGTQPDGGATGGSLNKWSQCQFCKVVITTVNLWRHIRTQHTPQPQRQCDHCRKKFKNKYSLREHVRIAHESKVATNTVADVVADVMPVVTAIPSTTTVVTTRTTGQSTVVPVSGSAVATNVAILKPLTTVKTINYQPSMY